MITAHPSLKILSQHRWNTPVLAHLARPSLPAGGTGGASRPAGMQLGFGELAEDLAVSRDSLARSLQSLIDPGWVAQPRAGHAYAITSRGMPIGAQCIRLVAAVDTLRQETLATHPGQPTLPEESELAPDRLAYRRWVWPLLHVLGQEPWRFNELKGALPGITSRALTTVLRDLDSAGWLQRSMEPGYPPVIEYRLGGPGELFLPILRAITNAAEETGGS